MHSSNLCSCARPGPASYLPPFPATTSSVRTTKFIRRHESNVLAKKQPGADEDQHGGEDDSEWLTGYARGESAPDQDAGDASDEQRCCQPQVHVALRSVGDAGNEREDGGVDDVRAYHDCRRQRVEQEQYDRHDAPRAYGSETYEVSTGSTKEDGVDLALE